MSTVFASITTPGPPGPPGRTPLWLTGSGIPSPGLGLDGDMYLNTVNSDVYGPKASGAWGAVVANIKGTPGATGATGPAGYSPLYIVASGPPASPTGNNGDMYLDSASSNLYGPKAAGVWGGIVANLKGGTGPQGPPGSAFVAKGAWSSVVTYTQGDEVTDVGVLYIALQSINLNHVPLSSPTWWAPLTGGGGSQTPWLSAIDAAGFALSNVGVITCYRGGTEGQVILTPSPSGTASGLTIWQQTPPTNAAAIQMGTPGAGGSSPDLIFSMFAGSWVERLRITAAGNVGIGTASPQDILHVARTQSAAITSIIVDNSGSGNGTGAALRFGYGAGTILGGVYHYLNAISQWTLGLKAWNNSAEIERVTINGITGNVGIGQPRPLGTLHVYGNVPVIGSSYTPSGSVGGSLLLDDSNFVGGSGGQIIFCAGNGAWQMAAIKGYAINGGGNSQGDIVFSTRRAASDAAFTETIRLTAAGNVGIGTAAPGVPLDVNGAARVATFYMMPADSGYEWWNGAYTTTGAWQIVRRKVSDSTWTAPLTILPSGNVGIGTASAAGTLEVQRSQTDGGTILRLAVGPDNGFNFSRNEADGSLRIQGNQTGFNNIVLCPTSGNVGIGTTLPQAPIHTSGMGAFASSNFNTKLIARFSGGGVVSHSAIVFDTGATGVTAWRGLQINYASQDFHIARYDSGGVANGIFDLTVLSNGNVGIGTGVGAGPAYKLDVVGDVNCSGAFRVNGTPISTGGSGGVTVQTTGMASSSRFIGNTYQNTFSGGKPVLVTVTCNCNASGSFWANCNSTNSFGAGNLVAQTTSQNASQVLSITFWVLPNYFYAVSSSGSLSLTYWTEWY